MTDLEDIAQLVDLHIRLKTISENTGKVLKQFAADLEKENCPDPWIFQSVLATTISKSKELLKIVVNANGNPKIKIYYTT